MKLPKYITTNQQKELAKLFHTVRQTQGIENALLLKRIIIVAAYGTMIKGKISFEDFLDALNTHLLVYNKSIRTFWGFASYTRIERDTMFYIPYKIILNGDEILLETLIIDKMRALINTNYGIKKEFKEYIKNIIYLK